MFSILRPRILGRAPCSLRYSSSNPKTDPLAILSGINKNQQADSGIKTSFLGESNFSVSGAFKEPNCLEYATKLPLDGIHAGRSILVRKGDLMRSIKRLETMTRSTKLKNAYYEQKFYMKPSKRKLQQRIKSKKTRFDAGIRKLLGVVRNAVRRGY
ncbi:hypothetical protein KL930_001436 [Ogataea haglerorum]|uniref:Uncharacterized protein n=1 Tax=Ogataea haglerorum TaxID=1937702 RepID=A0AAN6I004_9ASCO|nr:uncharacterized protein KL911_003837 [Ogataea haglerorum]KAG7695113.1 hypothetical protein KL915_003346 [Ogataea haglerorum]KAG7698658.1 hypothetical protein KL951_001922 [Ogataea haglerorum]KAG7724872.1 hypothetical protein KL948_005117 [Ogataea haglerorum]KAG7726357.1 hypothetical protein KL933_003288 [Ogataea haglerorum]KAG7737806.1 hypothetical protein KL923_003353 [Ogataea haglerorum]